MVSNCNIFAWNEYVKGKTDTLRLRKSNYSAWTAFTGLWWWRFIVRPVGIVIGYFGWGLNQLGALMATGHWWHVDTGKQEFYPLRDKSKHFFPPLLFEGEIRDVD